MYANKNQAPTCSTSCPLSPRVQGCKGSSATWRTSRLNVYLAPGHHVMSHVMQRTSLHAHAGGVEAWTRGGLRRAAFVSHHPPWILLGFLRAPPPTERSQLVSGRATGLPKEPTGPGRRMQGTEATLSPALNLPREQEPLLTAPSVPNTIVRALPVLLKFLPEPQVSLLLGQFREETPKAAESRRHCPKRSEPVQGRAAAQPMARSLCSRPQHPW